MEREKNGKFNSFFNFIQRVESKDVNKLQLEGFVKAGVFDEFDKDRNKILNSIQKIIQKIKNITDDKLNNQTNLFEKQKRKSQHYKYVMLVGKTKMMLRRCCYFQTTTYVMSVLV